MQPAGRAYNVVASATEQFELCLGNIRLLAGMMLDEGRALDRTERHDYLRAIERKAGHLLSVTASLGDFAQLGLRRTELARCELRFSEIAEQAIEALTPLVTRQRRLLVLAVNAGEPSISGDYRKLLQAFSGLLRHSLEIAVPAAQILIQLRAGAHTVRLEIDVPMDREAPARVTTGPQLSDAPASSTSELATELAAQIFEMHGGSLRTLTSERHQRFVIELPVAEK